MNAVVQRTKEMYGRPPTGSAANRPGTRAGNATSWGRGVPAGIPPRSGIPQSSGVSGSGVVIPPSTAVRRPGTAARGAFGINIIDRPTTQQGLGGLKTGTQSYGRFVQDKTFWAGELRQRLNAINAEISKMEKDVENYERDDGNYLSYEKRADSLTVEVRELQGQLGDYNLLVDKLHTDSDLDDIKKACDELKQKNQQDSQIVDDVFMLRQQRETEIWELDNQIEREKQLADSRIKELAATAQAEYFDLRERNTKSGPDISEKQMELDQLGVKIGNLEQEISVDHLRQKSLTLQLKIHDLATKKDELQSGLEQSSTENSPDQKEVLLKKVKEDNQEISTMERRINELDQEMKKLREQISNIDSELGDQKDEKAAKFEELVKRDNEMQEYLDSHDEKYQSATNSIQETEKQIAELMEKIKNLQKNEKLPSVDKFLQLKNDLLFKEKEVTNSANTVEAMLIERKRRSADLEKVNVLETKLESEVQNYREKYRNLQDELNKILDVEGSKRMKEQSREAFYERKLQYQNEYKALQAELTEITVKYESKKRQLEENDTYKQLKALETRNQSLESTVTELKQVIAVKTLDSDYQPAKNQVLQLINECNDQLIRIMAAAPAR